MEKNLFNKFLANSYFTQEIRARFNVLRAYLIAQFYNSKPENEFKPEELVWLKSLGTDFYKDFNRTNVYQLLDFIDAEIKKIKPLIIYTAFEISELEEGKLGLWLRKNFGADIIAQLKIDPNLIGGCALSWKGIYKDYSLKARIDQKHAEIITSLRGLLK